VNEQISLFESDSDFKVPFYVYLCNDDWSLKTKMIDGVPNIIEWYETELNKSELKEICRCAVKIGRPGIYGYDVFFEDDEGKKNIFVRFLNFTTSKKRTVFEHIDLYFDEVVRWRKESEASE